MINFAVQRGCLSDVLQEAAFHLTGEQVLTMLSIITLKFTIMKPIPQNVLAGFNNLLKQRNVPPMFFSDYRKWLFYFLDFRASPASLKLVAQFQYGCRLRISEGCSLRAKDFNCDTGMLTVRGREIKYGPCLCRRRSFRNWKHSWKK